MSRCRFVEDHQADYPVSRLCALAGVSRSGFYAWRCRPRSARALANERLLEEIRAIHERSRGTYGRVRIVGQLAKRGIPANHKRVARLMRINGLGGNQPHVVSRSPTRSSAKRRQGELRLRQRHALVLVATTASR